MKKLFFSLTATLLLTSVANAKTTSKNVDYEETKIKLENTKSVNTENTENTDDQYQENWKFFGPEKKYGECNSADGSTAGKRSVTVKFYVLGLVAYSSTVEEDCFSAVVPPSIGDTLPH
jgi:ABC-type uncharacterized transport system YnjBCD substrate-binding protein